MNLLTSGDVVIASFPGAQVTKARPALVLSTEAYQQNRPDVILGLLTTKIDKANTPADYLLSDWKQAGLHQPTAFRCYIVTIEQAGLQKVGRLTEIDFEKIKLCLKRIFPL